jgi:hypothetical protein
MLPPKISRQIRHLLFSTRLSAERFTLADKFVFPQQLVKNIFSIEQSFYTILLPVLLFLLAFYSSYIKVAVHKLNQN